MRDNISVYSNHSNHLILQYDYDKESDLTDFKMRTFHEMIYNFIFLSREYYHIDEVIDYIEFTDISSHYSNTLVDINLFKFIEDTIYIKDHLRIIMVRIVHRFRQLVLNTEWRTTILEGREEWIDLRRSSKEVLSLLDIHYSLDECLEKFQ